MTYESINGTLLGDDLTYLFVYANNVTGAWFVPSMVLSFFLVVVIGSAIMQLRFTSRIRPEVSFLAGCFATFGFATILEQVTGLLSPAYFIIIVGMNILGAIWVFLSSE